MKVLVTGQSGFVGRHVVKALHARGHDVIALEDLEQHPDAIIHTAWSGLPNYDGTHHLDNLGWQLAFLKKAVALGITNITITGTCLETLDVLTPYAIAKLALRARALELLPTLKWARLWYLWGDGQRDECLVPRLQRAVFLDGASEFHVIKGERDFINVSDAAERLVEICEGSFPEDRGIFDVCSGKAERVADFCGRLAPNMTFIEDYPAPAYEPFSFHGNP